MCRLWVIVTSSTPLKVYLFDGGVVIFGSVLKQRSAVDLPADDEVRLLMIGRRMALLFDSSSCSSQCCKNCIEH